MSEPAGVCKPMCKSVCAASVQASVQRQSFEESEQKRARDCPNGWRVQRCPASSTIALKNLCANVFVDLYMIKFLCSTTILIRNLQSEGIGVCHYQELFCHKFRFKLPERYVNLVTDIIYFSTG